jgi:hypothetical protein
MARQPANLRSNQPYSFIEGAAECVHPAELDLIEWFTCGEFASRSRCTWRPCPCAVACRRSTYPLSIVGRSGFELIVVTHQGTAASWRGGLSILTRNQKCICWLSDAENGSTHCHVSRPGRTEDRHAGQERRRARARVCAFKVAANRLGREDPTSWTGPRSGLALQNRCAATSGNHDPPPITRHEQRFSAEQGRARRASTIEEASNGSNALGREAAPLAIAYTPARQVCGAELMDAS